MADDPATLWDRSVAEYPVLGNQGIVYKYSPGRSREFLESWPPDEPGSDDRKRPGDFPLDKFGVEVFNPKTRPMDILGDVVSHRMINTDPTISGAYNNFKKSLEPWQEEILQEQYQHYRTNEGEQRPYEQWKEMSGVPSYFRGYAFQQWPENEWSRLYTPEQMKQLDGMMDYLRGGASSPQPQSPLAPGGTMKALTPNG